MKAKIIPHGEVTLDTRFPENNPDNPRYKRRLLAEGDSWFSVGSVPFENVLLELDFPERTIVVNIAEPGDEIVKMARRVLRGWSWFDDAVDARSAPRGFDGKSPDDGDVGVARRDGRGAAP